MNKTYIQIKSNKYLDTNISKFEKSSIYFDFHLTYNGNLNQILKDKNNENKKIVEFENLRKLEYEKMIQNENPIDNSFHNSLILRKVKFHKTLNQENNTINNTENIILNRAISLENENVIRRVKKKQNYFYIKKPKKIKIENISQKKIITNIKNKENLIKNKSFEGEKKLDKSKIKNFINQLRKRIKEREEEEKKKKREKEQNEKIKNAKIQQFLIEIEINAKRIQKEEKIKKIEKIEREKILKLKQEKLEEEERKKKEIEKEKVNKYLNKLKSELKNRLEEEKKRNIEIENKERIKKEKFQSILNEIKVIRNKSFNLEEEEKKKEKEEEERKLRLEEREKKKEEEIKKKKEEKNKKREERKLRLKEREKKKEEERIKKEEERIKKQDEIEEKIYEIGRKKRIELFELEMKIYERGKKEKERIMKQKEEMNYKQSFIKLERERRWIEEEEDKRNKEIEKIKLKINTLRNKIEIKKEEKLQYENLNEELKHKWRLEKINNLLNEFIKLNDNENIEQKLEIINEVGKYFKEEITYDKENRKNNIISIDKALINSDPLIKFVGILAEEFKNNGINSIIEKNTSDLNFVDNVFQLLLSKLSIEMKYEIKIKNIKLIEKFKKDISKYFPFLESLKYQINTIFNVNSNDIYFINNDIENFEITLVILNRRDVELTNLYKNDITIKKKNLLESVKFYLDFFENKYNRLNNNWERNNLIRGGEKYNPPYLWKGYALRVLNKFDNGDNSWLGNEGKENEWAIAYHGIGKGNEFRKLLNIIKNNLKSGPGQLYKNFPNIRDKNNNQIGIGVYLAPDLSEAENYSKETVVGSVKVKFIVMCRVNPKKIREPGRYPVNWIVDDNYDCLRPYRILVKECKWFS